MSVYSKLLAADQALGRLLNTEPVWMARLSVWVSRPVIQRPASLVALIAPALWIMGGVAVGRAFSLENPVLGLIGALAAVGSFTALLLTIAGMGYRISLRNANALDEREALWSARAGAFAHKVLVICLLGVWPYAAFVAADMIPPPDAHHVWLGATALFYWALFLPAAYLAWRAPPPVSIEPDDGRSTSEG
ncbi:MAG: hypothetical protein ACFB2Z_04215 [Maricaulaceae bacterium]